MEVFHATKVLSMKDSWSGLILQTKCRNVLDYRLTSEGKQCSHLVTMGPFSWFAKLVIYYRRYAVLRLLLMFCARRTDIVLFCVLIL